jgi:hypothetical protein
MTIHCVKFRAYEKRSHRLPRHLPPHEGWARCSCITVKAPITGARQGAT